MDSIHSKRRRYMREDYEAELQVKITARQDVDQKLQKVEWRCRDGKRICFLSPLPSNTFSAVENLT